MERDTQRIALAGLVGLHLLISVAHGSAHTSASVNLSAPATAFVFIVILAGPLVGLGWMFRSPVAGARVIGAAMAASFLFGLINHFIIAGADRVDHVAMEWRMMFGATAATLAIIEATGTWLGFAYGRRAVRRLA